MSALKVDGKQLWHVQWYSEWHDDPYDMFILSDREPTSEQCTSMYADEQGLSEDDEELQEFTNGHNVYSVYAEIL